MAEHGRIQNDEINNKKKQASDYHHLFGPQTTGEAADGYLSHTNSEHTAVEADPAQPAPPSATATEPHLVTVRRRKWKGKKEEA